MIFKNVSYYAQARQKKKVEGNNTSIFSKDASKNKKTLETGCPRPAIKKGVISNSLLYTHMHNHKISKNNTKKFITDARRKTLAAKIQGQSNPKKRFAVRASAPSKKTQRSPSTGQKKHSAPNASASKNLNDYKRFPEFIECNGKIVVNHDQPSTTSKNVELVSIYTDHMHENLIHILNTYAKNRIVIGCIAWLSNIEIINALSQASKVSLLVNDEDYSKWGFKTVKKEKYEKLPPFNTPFSSVWGNKIETSLNSLGNKIYEPVRCYGQEGKNGGGGGISSIMHAKFLVICDDNCMPKWLWSGSMNFTSNSTNNLEIATFIQDPEIALHAFFYFGNTFVLSKTLRGL
jgi:hypothetical protein